MIDDNESTAAERDRLKEIEDPVRVTIRIEAATHLRLKHAALDLGVIGISRLVEEACREWLETQRLDTAHR